MTYPLSKNIDIKSNNIISYYFAYFHNWNVKSNYDFIFAILGYDFTTQSFASWSTEVVFTEFKSGKSLYTSNKSFLKASTQGIAYYDNKSLDTQSIIFKEISINEFLKK